MNDRSRYMPGPANAQVRKEEGDKWTLVLVRQLRHTPEKVWQSLTNPEELREWAPFDVSGRLDKAGEKVQMTWVGAPSPIDTAVTHADAPHLLEFGDIRWELEPVDGGTKLTLLSRIDKRFVAMGAAGWHIALDALDNLIGGAPIGRIAGAEAMAFEGWQRLHAEYSAQFGVAAPSWSKQ